MWTYIQRAFFAAWTLSLVACGNGHGTETNNAAPQRQDAAPPAPGGGNTALVLTPDQGVSSSKHVFMARLEWLAGPSSTPSGTNTCRLTFADSQGHQLTSVKVVSVTPFLPSVATSGPVGPAQVTADPDNVDALIVTGFHFASSGHWALRIEAIADGVDDQVSIPVDVP